MYEQISNRWGDKRNESTHQRQRQLGGNDLSGVEGDMHNALKRLDTKGEAHGDVFKDE